MLISLITIYLQMGAAAHLFLRTRRPGRGVLGRNGKFIISGTFWRTGKRFLECLVCSSSANQRGSDEQVTSDTSSFCLKSFTLLNSERKTFAMKQANEGAAAAAFEAAGSR